VDDGACDTLVLGYIAVETHKFKAIDAKKLMLWLHGIDQWTEHVEECAHGKRFSRSGDALQCGAEKRSVEIAYTALVE
jgi:hypothetical protein